MTRFLPLPASGEREITSRGSTHPTSIRNAEPPVEEVHQPRRPDQQELQVLEERRLPAFDFVAGELEHPGEDEQRAGDPLEIDPDVLLDQPDNGDRERAER